MNRSTASLARLVRVTAWAAVLLLGAVPHARANLLVAFTGDAGAGAGSVQGYDAAGAPLGAAASGGGLSGPVHAVYGPDGNLYVSSIGSGQVLRYHGTTGAFLDAFVSGLPHDTAGGFTLGPLGLAFGPDGNLYVSNDFTEEVARFDGATGAPMGSFGSGVLSAPTGLAFGPDGNLYVGSFNDNRVRRFLGTSGTLDAAFTLTVGLPGTDVLVPGLVGGPEQLAFGPDGNLYVANYLSCDVERYDTGGAPVGTGLFVAAGAGGLSGAVGLAFGPDDKSFYVSSNNTARVLRYDRTSGAFLGVFVDAGPAGLTDPAFLTFARAVPEPGSATMWGLGLGVFVAAKGCRRKRKAPPSA